MELYYLSKIKLSVTQYGLWYLAFISVFAAAVTVFDKLSAKSHGRRVPEKTLLLISVFGGSAAMYAVMRIIHHKTRHSKFMVGIPFIIVLQVLLIALLFIFT